MEEQPIILFKNKGGHKGHHGGAWKVAYADFVTAMMSLFIVLWLMSSTSKQTQEQIAGYFNDPRGTASKQGLEGKPNALQTVEKKVDMAALKSQLLHAIDEANTLDALKKQIEITLTDEGLRIELVEEAKGTFFESGSAQPLPALRDMLKVLAGQLKTVPNTISIEGHTDAQPYTNQTSYGNWELSSDRANVARREMQADGIRPNQVSQVRGFADQQLHLVSRPFDPANRRISLVVQRLSSPGKVDGRAEKLVAGVTSAPPAAPAPHSAPALQPTLDGRPTAQISAKESSTKASNPLVKRVRGLFGS